MPASANTADVLIVGLGGMGSAAAYHLSRRGAKVIGIDRFHPPHAFGSSHGQTRIIREAYFEDPAYVPLVQHAYRLWDELTEQSQIDLFLKTGGLMIGPPGGVVFSGALRSAQTHKLQHEVLSAEEVHRRVPALRPAADMQAVWEPRAGILFPERCVEAHLKLAERNGAQLRYEEKVLSWSANGKGVRVVTERDELSAGQLVLSAGSWITELVPELKRTLSVERQVQFWFQSSQPELFTPRRCPIHLWEHAPEKFFYGFPDLGGWVKVAVHHEGQISDPDRLDRTVSDAEVRSMQQRIKPFMPAVNGPLLSSAVCMYTNTPDGHFLIDRHPDCEGVLIVSPCSGHGFKFSSAIGSVIADLILNGQTAFDLGLFQARQDRFA
jgi:sarcosine oxidase